MEVIKHLIFLLVLEIIILQLEFNNYYMKLSRYSVFSILMLLLLSLFLNPTINAQSSILKDINLLTLNNDSTNVIREITLSNVNEEIENTDNLIIKYENKNNSINSPEHTINRFVNLNAYIEQQGKEFKNFNPDNLSSFFLTNAQFTWAQFKKDLINDKKSIQKSIRETQIIQNYILQRIEIWKKSLPSIKKSLSPHILKRINNNTAELIKINRSYNDRIKTLLITENKIIEDLIYVETILEEITYTLRKHQTEIFKQNSDNIFSVNYKDSYTGSIKERIKLAIHENTKTLSYFYANVTNNIINYLFLSILLFSYLIFIRNKYLSLNITDDIPGHKSVSRLLINKPISSSVAILLVLWLVTIPYTPLFISKTLFLIILLSLLIAMSDYYDQYAKKITITITVLIIFNNLEMFAWYFGEYSRLYLLLETSIAIFLTLRFAIPNYKNNPKNISNSNLYKFNRLLTPIIFGLFIIAFFANIIGYTNLAIYTIKLSVYLGITTIIVFGFYRIINSIIQASVSVLYLYLPDLVNKYSELIISKSKKYLSFIMIIIWILTILEISEFDNFTDKFIVDLLISPITIGSLVFSISSLLLFTFVIYLTFILTRFTKEILEKEILAKSKLKRGMPAAISLGTRSIIVFFGVLISLSVSGMDLSKVSIIMGALSVGIGFGLQNVVNNFISGVILVYEKPIQEGDTVEVDNLLGKVTDMGIRASRVLTYDGAEVVVPNSNLTSNQLINWTLSDNKKRMAVNVGTAYGTDPNKVLEILKKVANEHQNVLSFPEPLPLFEGFGDSSLDFRILFWVHFEEGFTTKSDIAIGIYNAFAENGIEIPFPQVDLHVKDIVGNNSNNKELSH